MIEVLVDQTGDLAEADTAEAAVLAAVTMCREAYEHLGGTFKPTVTFIVDGEVVQARVPEPTLWLFRAV